MLKAAKLVRWARYALVSEVPCRHLQKLAGELFEERGQATVCEGNEVHVVSCVLKEPEWECGSRVKRAYRTFEEYALSFDTCCCFRRTGA